MTSGLWPAPLPGKPSTGLVRCLAQSTPSLSQDSHDWRTLGGMPQSITAGPYARAPPAVKHRGDFSAGLDAQTLGKDTPGGVLWGERGYDGDMMGYIVISWGSGILRLR